MAELEAEDKPIIPAAAPTPLINLDLLYGMDEPLELVIELERLARLRTGRRDWDSVAAYARLAKDEIKAANEAPPR